MCMRSWKHTGGRVLLLARKSKIHRKLEQDAVTCAGESEAPGGAVGGVLHQPVVTQTLVVHVALQLRTKQLVGGRLNAHKALRVELFFNPCFIFTSVHAKVIFLRRVS